MGEAKCCAIEVLDSILFTKLGLHILEAQIEVKEVAVAKLQFARTPGSQAGINLNSSHEKVLVSEPKIHSLNASRD